MKNVKFETAGLIVTYNGSRLTAQVKGVKTVHSVRPEDINSLPQTLIQFITGKKRAASWKRACAARGWKTPISLFEKEQLRLLREEANRAEWAAREAEAEMAEKAAELRKEELRHAVIELLKNPTQSNREQVQALYGNWTCTLCSPLAEPESYNNRKRLQEAVATAVYWGRLFQSFDSCPLGQEMQSSHRGYFESFFFDGRFRAPVWVWDYKNFLERAEARMQELNSFDGK
jgi:hypothetical protein